MPKTETVIDLADVTCPSCSAAEGEPCSKYCDDDAVGMLKRGRRSQWDDGEVW